MKGILLVDGTNAVRRRLAANPNAPHSQLVSEVVDRVKRATSLLHCTYCSIAFDDPNENWRTTLYPGYKADRPSIDTTALMRAAWTTLKLEGYHCGFVKGFEADDVIASLAYRSRQRRIVKPVTLSSDNDLLQLAGIASVFKYNHVRGGEPFVENSYAAERFGVVPERYPEFLTLVGGKNGVSGLPGVGEKTAAKLLGQHPDFESLVTSEAVPVEQRQHLRLALQLHTLRTDVPLDHVATRLGDFVVPA